MNTIRMIAIALPMTLLMACGGGGGGSGTAAVRTPTPMTPPTNGDDPDMPPATITPPSSTNPQTLPSYLIAETDLSAIRTKFAGSAPTVTGYSDIIRAIRTRASAADTLDVRTLYAEDTAGLQASGRHTPTCSDTSCSVMLPDVGDIRFSLNEIHGLALIDDMGLEGYNVDVQAVMIDDGVTLVQGSGAARGDGGTPFTFQSYGGWLSNSAFGIQQIEVTATSATTYQTPYSFGNASGTNPRGSGSMTWNGVIVVQERFDGSLRHGDATIDIDDLSNPDVDVFFSFSRLGVGGAIEVTLDNIALMNGNFESSANTIKGSFYGNNHEEVAGTYITNIYIGAFGAKR